MPRVSNEERRRLKEEAILESARSVFLRKGFIDVTMKDIIEECGISRGGIYLYYDSVDDIFVAGAAHRNKRKFEVIRDLIKTNMPFLELLDAYFEMQKNRLLHMENSMLRSMYEYFFTHKGPEDRRFQQSQFDNVKNTIIEILELGVRQGCLDGGNIAPLAENFMFVIEGLSVLALLGGITQERIDIQFKLMRSMLPMIEK